MQHKDEQKYKHRVKGVLKIYFLILILFSFNLSLSASDLDSLLRKPNLKIFDIGNSYTDDATTMLPDLVTASGADVSDMCLYSAYRGGATFMSWYNTYNDNDNDYYRINKVLGGLSANIEIGNSQAYDGSLFRKALTQEQWDLILIHQASLYAPNYEMWGGTGPGGYLNELLALIRELQPQAKIGFYVVHSYWDNHQNNIQKSSYLRWQKIVSSVQQLLANYEIDFVVPYGTAVENLRASSYNNEYDLTRDGTHCELGLCRYTAAAAYYQALIYPRTGISVLGNTARYNVTDTNFPYPPVAVTDDNAIVAQKAAVLANQNWSKCVNPEKAHIVTYRVDDSEYAQVVVEDGKPLRPISPEKEWYTFSGWGEVPEVMPDQDITLSGTFSPNRYVLTFIVDGDTIQSDSVPHHTPIVLPDLPEKEGATFSGWGEVPELMPLYDLTLMGTFTRNCYTLTFVADDKIVQSGIVPYGSTLRLPTAPKKDNYVFQNWGEAPDAMPDHDLTLTAFYLGVPYALAYLVDGDTLHVDSVPYNSPITLMEEPVKEGHTFSGWSEVPETMPLNDLTVTGTFTPNEYALIFMSEGDTLQVDSLLYGSPIVLPEDPVKENYVFQNWGEVPETMPAHDVTLTAVYEGKRFLLSFVVDGDTLMADSVPYNDPVVVPEEPVKEGHTFSGWGEVPETMPLSDLTVTGTFTPNKYALIFMQEGDTLQVDSLLYDSPIVLPEDPVKENYVFQNWGEVPETMPAYDVTLTAVYEGQRFLLSFVVDGDTLMTDSVPYNDPVILPEEPVKEGHTFSGWGEVPETMPANDLTVTGTFTPNEYALIFMSDGDTLQVDSLLYGSPIVLPEDPVKENYVFLNWGEVPETLPAHDVTLTAVYEGQRFLLSFVVDGDTLMADSVPYNDPVVLLEEPVKEGHTFSGWSEVPETMPLIDLTITGTFTPNEYALIFMSEGDTLQVDSLLYGSLIVLPEDPVKENYVFQNWGEVPETMPAYDVTLTAVYEGKRFLLSFVVDGDTLMSDSVPYNDPVVVPEEPVKEGHTFSGWGEVPETMPANDLTVTGTFTPNKYALIFMVEGDTLQVDSVLYGSPFLLPDVDEKVGHSFSWEESPEVMPANDLTLHGYYTIKKYALTFTVDGDTLYTDTLFYNAPIIIPDAPVKEGCTFSGWGEVPDLMPANNLTIAGSFLANTFVLTYMVNGEVFKTMNKAYGAPIEHEEYPVEEGYTFSGWGKLPETMPAANMIVNGMVIKAEKQGDVNGDGFINISDVTTLVNIILQK